MIKEYKVCDICGEQIPLETKSIDFVLDQSFDGLEYYNNIVSVDVCLPCLRGMYLYLLETLTIEEKRMIVDNIKKGK